jgi:DNA-binding MarR family transcriptional regulator
MAPPPGDPVPLVQRLIALVNRKSAGASIGFMHASGLTMPQIVVLYALRNSGAEVSISGMAERLRMSLPATSQLVDRLVEAGLVQRAESASDRRVRRVSILSDGLRFLEQLGEMRAREIEDALRSLRPDSRAALTSALTQVVSELEQELEGGNSPRPPPRGQRGNRRRS